MNTEFSQNAMYVNLHKSKKRKKKKTNPNYECNWIEFHGKKAGHLALFIKSVHERMKLVTIFNRRRIINLTIAKYGLST